MSTPPRRAAVAVVGAALLALVAAPSASADATTTVTHTYPCTDDGTRSTGLTYRAEVTQTLTTPDAVPADGSFTVRTDIATLALDARGGGAVTVGGGTALRAGTGTASVGYDVPPDNVQVALTPLVVPAQQLTDVTTPGPVTIRDVTGAESQPVPGDAVPGSPTVTVRIPQVVELELPLVAPDGTTSTVRLACNDPSVLAGPAAVLVPVVAPTGTRAVVLAGGGAVAAAGAGPAPAGGPGGSPTGTAASSSSAGPDDAGGTASPAAAGRSTAGPTGVLGTGVPGALAYPVLVVVVVLALMAARVRLLHRRATRRAG